MQKSVDKFSSACSNFELPLALRRLKVLHQPAPGNPYIASNLTVNGQSLINVDKFPYHRNIISQNANIDSEVVVRFAKASAAFGRLYDKDWNRKWIRLQTKLKVCKAIVVPTLLYGSETRAVLYRCHSNKLNHFHAEPQETPQHQMAA